MPLIPPAMTALLTGYMGAGGIFGVSSPQLATAVSNGFCQYAISSVVVNTVDVGAAGTGTGVGIGMVLAPPALIGSLTAAFEGAQIRGPLRQSLIVAIANAISDTLKLALINTVNAGVGAGSGKATLVPNPGTSVPLMVANFFGLALVGVSSPVLASAIAQGIDQALPSATGVIAIAGAAGPSPGTGTGVGKIT